MALGFMLVWLFWGPAGIFRASNTSSASSPIESISNTAQQLASEKMFYGPILSAKLVADVGDISGIGHIYVAQMGDRALPVLSGVNSHSYKIAKIGDEVEIQRIYHGNGYDSAHGFLEFHSLIRIK